MVSVWTRQLSLPPRPVAQVAEGAGQVGYEGLRTLPGQPTMDPHLMAGSSSTKPSSAIGTSALPPTHPVCTGLTCPRRMTCLASPQAGLAGTSFRPTGSATLGGADQPSPPSPWPAGAVGA